MDEPRKPDAAPSEPKGCLVLFSGGQDSSTCLAWALERFARVETIGFDYGQRHAIELACRQPIIDALKSQRPDWAARLGGDHLIDLGLIGRIGQTALTQEIDIEMLRSGLPTLRVIPSPRIGRYGRVESLGWVLPIDDHSFRIYVVGRVRENGELVRMRSRLGGKLWEELSEAAHQRYPGDYEAQVSQGVVAFHSEEHLVTSDIGVAKLRRLLKQQLDALAHGRDPAGVSFDPDAPPVQFSAGNFLID